MKGTKGRDEERRRRARSRKRVGRAMGLSGDRMVAASGSGQVPSSPPPGRPPANTHPQLSLDRPTHHSTPARPQPSTTAYQACLYT